MKAFILSSLFAGTALFSCAQNIRQADVPSLVLNSFQKAYPNAVDIEWEKQLSNYSAEFEISNMDHEVWLDEKGNILKHEEDIQISQLPVAVINSIKQNYAAAQIDDVDKVEEGGKTYYVVEFEKWSGDKYVSFNEDGSIHK